MTIAFLNGQPATADDLRALAISNYGHFTSMPVRGGAVRGLDLHLQRLREATAELFATELDEARVREALRHATRMAQGDGSLRLTVFSRDFDYRQPLQSVPLDLLTTWSPPAPPSVALRLKSYPFVRPLPQIKHVATFPLFHYRRLARLACFDDALFVEGAGPQAAVVEGTVWNLGLWDGQGIVWPQGPALRGTSERMLQSGLERIGVPQQWRRVRLDELAGFSGAFAANASQIQLIAEVDGQALPQPPELDDLLIRALAQTPWLPL
ncbi:class IV aminotransferase [Pseudoxanthomonas kalamensis DSM 18571]|uniref:aminotransferase class IV family protein n=1 Tax=Pseudoxanthomonas kalamensis TaxID=289483 RepID=UPI00139200B1|nr:aminotransferase class IV family protein [Pseudoxanthomonas kalamensis]KAF1710499.1 class IV aminotransferase [Pseudoxanthomonas kalamensis DSM 18571]